MAIDHGLGGRDNEKSKRRREKKARRTKLISKKALKQTKDGKKKEVVYDEEARAEYVSGFHKRKQERRKFGLAMEVLKKQKAHKVMLKDQRVALRSQLDEVTAARKRASGEDAAEEEAETALVHDPVTGSNFGKYMNGVISVSAPTKQVQSYEDVSTVSMFGSAVDVIVDEQVFSNQLLQQHGDGDDDDENAESAVDEELSLCLSDHRQKQQLREPSRLQRALKKAKIQMASSKNKRGSGGKSNVAGLKQQGKKGIARKVETKQLLTKALGKKLQGRKKQSQKRQ